MTETVLTADGKPAARTNSLEGRRETDLQDKPPDGGLDGKPSSPTQAFVVGPRDIEAYSVFRPLSPLHMALTAQNRGVETNMKEISHRRDGCRPPISFLSMKEQF